MKHLTDYKLFESEPVDQKWYHGTDHEFDTFENRPDVKGPSAVGIWATDGKDLAEMFGEHVYEVEVSYKKPYEIDMDEWNEIRTDHAGDTAYFKQWKQELIDKGYDALFVKENDWEAHNFKDPNMVAVFNTNQIKKIR